MIAHRELNQDQTSTGRVVKLWSLVQRHLPLIAFAAMIGIGLGYLYYVKTPPTYESSCSLLVRNESASTAVPFQGIESSDRRTNHHEQPHALLIVSPLVVKQAINKPVEVDSQSDEPKPRLRDLPSLQVPDDLVSHILSHLAARPSLQNNLESHEIITITYSDKDPQVTQVVLDAVIESYQDFLGQSHKNFSTEVLELIEDAKATVSTHLKEVTDEYTEFRLETPLMFGDTKTTNVHSERMKEIEAARARLSILSTERRAELNSLKEALAQGGSREAIARMLRSIKPDPSVADGAFKSPEVELFELILQEQLLLNDLGPDHPKVLSVRKRIAFLEALNSGEEPAPERPKKVRRSDYINVCMDAIQHEINSIDAKILDLDELFESERDGSKQITAYEIKNEEYKKEISRTEDLYQQIIKRLDELNILQDYGGYKTAVLSAPEIGKRVAPSLTQSLLIGCILGMAAGLLLSYLAEISDKTFRTPEEIADALNLPVIGHTPVIQIPAAQDDNSEVNPILIAYHKPKSRAAESYRAIRTSLYFSTRGENYKVIQITSPNPSDGKSTLCANLCVSMAQSGKKVLLIDGDFRRPRVHEILSLSKSIGISSVITGDTELPDAIQPTVVENLWALPCGPRPNNPCELLTSRRFDELLELLKAQYDFVIIDTPPLLAVTDPAAVAPRVDGVILAVRLSQRSRHDSTKAIEILAGVGANVLGVVVNGANKKNSYGYYSNYYSGYYGYNYSYGGNGLYGTRSSDASSEHPYYMEDEDVESKELLNGHPRKG